MPIEPHDPEEFDRTLSSDALNAAIAATKNSRRQRMVRVVTVFLMGQGALQLINVLAGFFLVHRLSIEAYAQFGLAISFQGVFAILMDFGFAGTIVPLVGDRRDDPALIGRYVRAAKHFRDRSFAILAPVAIVVFLAVMHRHHWSWTVQALLLSSVLLSLYSSGTLSYFSAPLFIFGKLREFYIPQVVSGSMRLMLYGGLALGGGLNAWTAAGCSALNITVNARQIRRAASKYLRWPKMDDAATDRELLRYIVPAAPAIIFSAFQSQISLFLVSIFGGTLYIAEVMALSRLGLLFASAMTFNTMVTEPYIARHSRTGLFRTYVVVTLGACAACMPVVLLGFLRPGIFVWLLGAKYDGVRDVMGWYMVSSSISFVAGVIWIMNRARKWVFWSGSILEVVSLVGIQFGFLAFVGVRTTKQAVMFNLASSFCYLTAHVYVAIYGFLGGPKVKPDSAQATTIEA